MKQICRFTKRARDLPHEQDLFCELEARFSNLRVKTRKWAGHYYTF